MRGSAFLAIVARRMGDHRPCFGPCRGGAVSTLFPEGPGAWAHAAAGACNFTRMMAPVDTRSAAGVKRPNLQEIRGGISMAKKATGRGAGTTRTSRKSSGSSSRSVARVSSSGGGRSSSQEGMGDAFIKLLQSPLVAELVAVAATAALASLAEHGFTSSGGSRGRSRRSG